MSIGAIQNMTNRPWLKQPYNGLLVLVIKCFHLLQKFQIFLAHHLFHSGSTVKDPKQIWHFWSAWDYYCTKLVSFTIPVMTNWQKFVVPNKWFPCLGICWVACNRDIGWSYSISKFIHKFYSSIRPKLDVANEITPYIQNVLRTSYVNKQAEICKVCIQHTGISDTW